MLLFIQINDPEFHLSVGTALCSAALGGSSPQVLTKWEFPSKNFIPAQNDSMKWLLEEILEKYVVHRIPVVRQVRRVCKQRTKFSSSTFVFYEYENKTITLSKHDNLQIMHYLLLSIFFFFWSFWDS